MESSRVTFYDLLKESVIVQGLIALTCIIGTFVLLAMDHPIPEYVWILDASVVSFFFGAKSLFGARQQSAESIRLAAENVRVMADVAEQNVKVLQAIAGRGVGGAVGGMRTEG